MLTCKEVTRLVSDSLDRPLPLWRRLQMWVHLRMCALCLRFRDQTLFLRAAAQAYMRVEREAAASPREQLSAATRERIKQALRLYNQ